MRSLPVLPLGRLGVVTGSELVTAGWSVGAVRHALEMGGLVRVAPGRFAPPLSPALTRFQRQDLDLARRAIAAVIPVRRTAVGLLGAAVVSGWPIWADRPRACVCVIDPRVRKLTGVHVHRTADVDAFIWSDGLPITRPERTVVEIAREFGVEAALVTGDAAMHRGELDLTDLERDIARAHRLPGAEHARALPALLDPLAESPLESRGRYRCHLHGVPPTHSQVWIRTRGGRLVGRVDHYWADGVVGEADGALKYQDDTSALPDEKRRQQALEDLDLQVVRWGARDLRDFGAAEARIRRARVRAHRLLAEGPPLWIATTRDGVRIPAPDTP